MSQSSTIANTATNYTSNISKVLSEGYIQITECPKVLHFSTSKRSNIEETLQQEYGPYTDYHDVAEKVCNDYGCWFYKENSETKERQTTLYYKHVSINNSKTTTQPSYILYKPVPINMLRFFHPKRASEYKGLQSPIDNPTHDYRIIRSISSRKKKTGGNGSGGGNSNRSRKRNISSIDGGGKQRHHSSSSTKTITANDSFLVPKSHLLKFKFPSVNKQSLGGGANANTNDKKQKNSSGGSGGGGLMQFIIDNESLIINISENNYLIIAKNEVEHALLEISKKKKESLLLLPPPTPSPVVVTQPVAPLPVVTPQSSKKKQATSSSLIAEKSIDYSNRKLYPHSHDSLIYHEGYDSLPHAEIEPFITPLFWQLIRMKDIYLNYHNNQSNDGRSIGNLYKNIGNDFKSHGKLDQDVEIVITTLLILLYTKKSSSVATAINYLPFYLIESDNVKVSITTDNDENCIVYKYITASMTTISYEMNFNTTIDDDEQDYKVKNFIFKKIKEKKSIVTPKDTINKFKDEKQIAKLICETFNEKQFYLLISTLDNWFPSKKVMETFDSINWIFGDENVFDKTIKKK